MTFHRKNFFVWKNPRNYVSIHCTYLFFKSCVNVLSLTWPFGCARASRPLPLPLAGSLPTGRGSDRGTRIRTGGGANGGSGLGIDK